jgi:hypothetical protein
VDTASRDNGQGDDARLPSASGDQPEMPEEQRRAAIDVEIRQFINDLRRLHERTSLTDERPPR